MEKKNTLLLTVIAVATLLVAVVGATFAYFGSFTTTVDNKAGVNVTTEAAKSSTFLTTAASLKLNVAGSEMLKGTDPTASSVGTYTGDNAVLTVSLNATDETTTTTCKYDIYYVYDSGSAVYGAGETPVTTGTENKEFTYTLTPSDGITVDSTYATVEEKDFSVFSSAKTEVKVASGEISVSNGTATQTLTAYVKFYNFPTIDQSALAAKSFAGQFYVKDTTVVCGTTAK